ncbi:MAG: putative toxin-antitoxin system toxin component, PIN family [Terracidiphilus sp.]|jgi:putative PIN family toxin of toxin-antitoxin system
MSGLRVVLDTNVLLSGLAYPASIPGQIVTAWKQGAISVVLSRYILDEVVRSLPRISRVPLSPDEVRDVVDSLALIAEVVEPVSVDEDALRDKADLPVLGTLAAAQADYLITGDKDLLALAGRYPIVTPAAFLGRHGG